MSVDFWNWWQCSLLSGCTRDAWSNFVQPGISDYSDNPNYPISLYPKKVRGVIDVWRWLLMYVRVWWNRRRGVRRIQKRVFEESFEGAAGVRVLPTGRSYSTRERHATRRLGDEKGLVQNRKNVRMSEKQSPQESPLTLVRPTQIRTNLYKNAQGKSWKSPAQEPEGRQVLRGKEKEETQHQLLLWIHLQG